MRIGLDMMGGDYAPEQACLGVIHFLSTYSDCHLVLLGDQEAIRKGIPQWESLPVTIVSTQDEIGMHEHPTKAMKEKPNSAMVVGFGMLAKGALDAFLSAGNTGVMLVGASHMVKKCGRIITAFYPNPSAPIEWWV